MSSIKEIEGSIELDNVLSYVDIMRDRGVYLTGCKEFQSVSAAHLSMFMADLPPAVRIVAKDMLTINVGYS